MKNMGVYLLEQTGAQTTRSWRQSWWDQEREKGFCDLAEKFAQAKMSTKESLCLCHLFFHLYAQISMLIDVKYYRYVVRPYEEFKGNEVTSYSDVQPGIWLLLRVWIRHLKWPKWLQKGVSICSMSTDDKQKPIWGLALKIVENGLVVDKTCGNKGWPHSEVTIHKLSD